MKNHVHSLNSSPGKQKYSFGKAGRFDQYKPKTDVSYLPPITKDRRSAIIGYGQRSVLANKNQKIYPHAYSIPSTLDGNHGNSMKAGRHDIGGALEILRYNKSIPGPGQYTLPSTLENRGTSLKPRLADFSLKYLKEVPGPGAYSVPSSISNGDKNPFQSRFSVGGGPKIPPQANYSLDLRTPTYEKKQVPGPGQYSLEKYGLGNPEAMPYKREGLTKFGKEKRPSIVIQHSTHIPGPGEYKIYSQFDD